MNKELVLSFVGKIYGVSVDAITEEELNAFKDYFSAGLYLDGISENEKKVVNEATIENIKEQLFAVTETSVVKQLKFRYGIG